MTGSGLGNGGGAPCGAAVSAGTYGMLQAAAPLRIARWNGREGGPGTIVLVHGRAEFIEVYQETIDWMVGRGFAVIAFDFRGQGGSRRWTRGTGHVASFGDYVADLSAVVRHAAEVGMPRPFHILAHSMGGLVALLAAETLRREVERMVLLAPLLGIERLPLPAPVIGLVSGAARLSGLGRLAATRAMMGTQPFEGNRITSDPVRYARLGAQVDAYPELTTGVPTLGWLGAALGAIRRVRRMEGRPLPIPSLFVASGADTIVSTPAIDRFARSVAGGGLVIIPDARHQVLIERDELRGAALAAISTFLEGAPRRLSRVPPRQGRPLKVTPLPPPAPVAKPAEAAVPAVAVTSATAVEPTLTAAAPAVKPASRQDRRAERLRERLRRRDERGGKPVRSAADAVRQEPRLGGPRAAEESVASAPLARAGEGADITAQPTQPPPSNAGAPSAADRPADEGPRTSVPPATPEGPLDPLPLAPSGAPATGGAPTSAAGAETLPATTASTPPAVPGAGDAGAIRLTPEPRPWATGDIHPGARGRVSEGGDGIAAAEGAINGHRHRPHNGAHAPAEPVQDAATQPPAAPAGDTPPPPQSAPRGEHDGAGDSGSAPAWPQGPGGDTGDAGETFTLPAWQPAPGVESGDARDGGRQARLVDRLRRTPPMTPRPVRGKGGRKR